MITLPINLMTFDPKGADRTTLVSAQQALREVDCYNGSLDADWGDHCRAGLLTFKKMKLSGGKIQFFVNRTPILLIPGDLEDINPIIFWVGPAQVDGDGPNGNPEGDRCWQPTTTLKVNGHSLDSRKLRGMVVCPQVRALTDQTVMGSQGKITNIETGQTTDVVVYDEGGHKDDGEISFAATKKVSVPSSPISGGTPRPIMQYEVEVGKRGVQDGVTYPLLRA